MKTVRTLTIIAVLFILPASLTYGEDNYIGIILDGYQENCTVHSDSEKYECAESRHLFKGDKVIKKPDTKDLKIKWAPYSSGTQLDKTTLLVVFEPPQNKQGIVDQVREFFGFVKTGHSVSIGATRGGSQEPLVTQPNNNATVIAGRKISFVRESGVGRYLIFKDSRGEEIFRKEITGEGPLLLTPEEIGFSPGEVYTWNMGGLRNSRELRIRLLGEDAGRQIRDDLSRMDSEGVGEAETLIKKAGYLQLISSLYPEDVDLYWLSYLFLDSIKDEDGLNKENKILVNEMKKNYTKHVQETM